MRALSLILSIAMFAGPLAYAEDADEEPKIEIRYGKDETLYEYQINGEIVEIKVVPKVGPVYYLVPLENGDYERSETSRIRVPSWKLLEW